MDCKHGHSTDDPPVMVQDVLDCHLEISFEPKTVRSTEPSINGFLHGSCFWKVERDSFLSKSRHVKGPSWESRGGIIRFVFSSCTDSAYI